MVAYSFQKQFVEPILAGTKRQTIRADRKRHARPGERVQLFTGMRTKYCSPIGVATCEAVMSVQLDFQQPEVRTICGASVMLIGCRERLDDFAQGDGFNDWEQMRAFWLSQHGQSPFNGTLIRWTDFTPVRLIDFNPAGAPHGP